MSADARIVVLVALVFGAGWLWQKLEAEGRAQLGKGIFLTTLAASFVLGVAGYIADIH